MASWRAAESLKTLLNQVNRTYPNRNKDSDGLIGNLAHQATVSQHNPNAAGVVTAQDITHDPAHGVDGQKLADQLIQDPRAWYVIFNNRIRYQGKAWERYTGINPHKTHMHISTVQNPAGYDNPANWNLGTKGGYKMNEWDVKEMFLTALRREATPAEVKAWVGLDPAKLAQGLRTEKRWLDQNHAITYFPEREKRIKTLEEQVGKKGVKLAPGNYFVE
jgi:hypothetical protein